MIVYVVMYEEETYEGYNLHSVWANEQDAIDTVEKISEPGHHAYHEAKEVLNEK